MNLRKLRESLGMTVPQVCLAIGISQATYQPWELGRGYPRPMQIVRMCNLFGYYDVYRMCAEELRFRREGKDLIVNNVIYKRA